MYVRVTRNADLRGAPRRLAPLRDLDNNQSFSPINQKLQEIYHSWLKNTEQNTTALPMRADALRRVALQNKSNFMSVDASRVFTQTDLNFVFVPLVDGKTLSMDVQR